MAKATQIEIEAQDAERHADCITEGREPEPIRGVGREHQVYGRYGYREPTVDAQFPQCSIQHYCEEDQYQGIEDVIGSWVEVQQSVHENLQNHLRRSDPHRGVPLVLPVPEAADRLIGRGRECSKEAPVVAVEAQLGKIQDDREQNERSEHE